MTTNAEVFARGESDEWYRRNRSKLDTYNLDTDALGQAIIKSGIKPSFIVDMGCSSGKRLINLTRYFKVPGLGIDLSYDAIQDAQRAENKTCTWKVGDLDTPLGRPLVNGLMIYSWVLHWADRPQLCRTFASWFTNAAYIAIADFWPLKDSERVWYHHLPEQRVWTYKERYSELFLHLGKYDFEYVLDEVSLYESGPDKQELAILRRKAQ